MCPQHPLSWSGAAAGCHLPLLPDVRAHQNGHLRSQRETPCRRREDLGEAHSEAQVRRLPTTGPQQ